MRTISPSEFVRRLKHGVVAHEGRIVWFLGAGCSVSSGVEDAGTLTSRWLGELKYLETGDRDDLEDWAESRFPTYDRNDPAAAYIQVHEALFYTDLDQQREQERLSISGQPGFGYATLAQLLAHEKWGERCNTVITTNFDDLAADALYLYSQRKPQVLTHESFDRHVQISDARPTIVKLYGDAHLGAEYLDGNRRLLRTDVKERLRALATECTLVFVGYGGRDDSILDLFEDMPKGAPSGGVYWVNDRAPGKSLEGWLEERRAVWAQNASFDDLMFLLRQEFELGHPRIDRFDQILQKYDEQYRSLASQKPKAAPAAEAPIAAEPATPAQEPSATYKAATEDAKSWPVAAEAPPAAAPGPARPAPSRSDAKPVAEPAAFAEAMAAEDNTALDGQVMPPPQTEPLSGEPIVDAVLAMKARAQVDADRVAVTAAPIETISETAEAEFERASLGAGATVDMTSNSDGPHLDLSPEDLPEVNGMHAEIVQQAAVDETAPQIEAVDVTDFSLDASVHDEGVDDDVLELDEEVAEAAEAGAVEDETGSRERIDKLIAAAVKAMATDTETPPTVPPAASEAAQVPDGSLEGRPAPFVPPMDAVVAQALPEKLKATGRRADDSEITDIVATVERADAGPLEPPSRVLSREDAAALDGRFRAALSDTPRDGMLLANYAQFLTVGRQDHDGAEHYFNRAVDAEPQNDRTLRMFARFLTDVRRDSDRAEDCYRLAIRANFESAETMCDYAEFLWHARGDVETAGECFQVAVDAAPRDGTSLVRYARFLQDVQRNDDAAYALLKLAAANAERDPAPVVALAQFLATRRDEVEKAEQSFARAMEIGADSSATLLAAAQFHAVSKNDPVRAEELFDLAVAADPKATAPLLSYADFLHARRGDPARAEKMLLAAMDANPASAQVAMAYAKFRDEVLVDDEAAEDTFRKAINLDPKDATVLAAYGRFLHQSRRKANAAEDRFRKAVALEPRNVDALRSYGQFLVQERNNAEEGERYLRRAVSAGPSDAEALADLAEFLGKHTQRREETEEMFRRALAAGQGNRRTLRRYARYLSDVKGDPNAAEALYAQVLDTAPKDPRALAGAAHAMFVQGRRLEGLKRLDQAFDAAMGDEPRRRSIDLLLELWFYRYAYDHSSGRDAIKAAIWLVKEGAKVTRIDIRPIVARALVDAHPEPDILRELSKVVAGTLAPERLERFSVA